MVKMTDTVYCYTHGDIHRRTGDPYAYGKRECRASDWRSVYVRQHKGDYAEDDL